MTSEAPPLTGLALQVKDLRVTYGPKRAVDGVSLDINEGEIFGLLGPNGAGKTSTLSAIEGLLEPTSGSILIRQVDVRAYPGLAKALMGVQLQSTSFQSELKISENVKLYAGLYVLERDLASSDREHIGFRSGGRRSPAKSSERSWRPTLPCSCATTARCC